MKNQYSIDSSKIVDSAEIIFIRRKLEEIKRIQRNAHKNVQ